MSKNRIVEIIYVDEKRLDKYFQQFSSPEKKEKTHLGKIKLGFPNVGIEINQIQNIRNFTPYEKLELFENYLDKHKQLSYGRPDDNERWDNDIVFIKESVIAQKIYLAPNDNNLGMGLNIWVVEKSFKNQGHLFLIEDFKGEDKRPTIISGYSILSLLFDEYHEELNKTILGGNNFERVENSYFSKEPLNELKIIGAKFLDNRNIITVYRLRGSCIDMPNEGHVSTFGYPIYIIENE